MLDRRAFLGSVGLPLLAGAVLFDPRRAAAAVAALAGERRAPDEVAADEDVWRPVQQAFTVDRSLVNLNNGGVSPAPRLVQDAMARHLAYSHQAPAYTMWRVLEPQRETVRARLARAWGVQAEEVALTRNASEGLQICQLGFDLAPGDEVLTSTQDYPRMLATFRQRERREGIVLRQVRLPVPCEDGALVVQRFEEGLTERTRMILVSHVIFLTGQVLPVAEVCALGRRHGIPVIVDGAHALAHLDFRLGDLGCDFYASSLHKWLHAPHGTGLLYVRRERIPGLWPLMAAPEELTADIRKFEEIGTHPAANALAVAEALTFHEGVGGARKEARLRLLRDRWARRLAAHDRVRLHTSLDPAFSCGIATFSIDGVAPGALVAHLWERHRILVTPIEHEDVSGVRVSPSVYTTLDEVDRFADAVEAVLREGLPA